MVAIDGRLGSADSEEVQRVRESLSGEVVLDLGGLEACDHDGVRLLRDWLKAGAHLGSVTPFLQMVLEGVKGRASPRNT